MSAAREAILQRIREATAGAAAPAPSPRAYRREGTLDPQARLDLLCERIGDYRATVARVKVRRVEGGRLSADELRGEIEAILASSGARRIGIPAGLPPEWRPAGIELVEDVGLTAAELDRLDGVVTGCTVAIAETGTLVLTSGPHEGRRALTLVPDLHLCIVEERQIVELVPEAMSSLAGLVRDERRPLTLISGPSATSDIELSRVEGVHGPRTLIVVILVESLE